MSVWVFLEVVDFGTFVDFLFRLVDIWVLCGR